MVLTAAGFDESHRLRQGHRQVADNQVKQLEFFIEYLESTESLLSRDAYDEFAQAPYAVVVAIKNKLDREKLLKWIQDPSMPADHKRLYLVMLGICGQEKDAELIEKMLRSEDPNQRFGSRCDDCLLCDLAWS